MWIILLSIQRITFSIYQKRADGLILLVLFGIFIYYTLYEYTDYWKERKENKEENEVKLKLKLSYLQDSHNHPDN